MLRFYGFVNGLTLDGSSPADDALLAGLVAELQRLAALEQGLSEARRRHQRN